MIKRLLSLFLISVLSTQSSALLWAATGCPYPTTLDTFADKSTGDFLTVSDVNVRSCAIEKIEAELGTLPKGSFGSVKARLDDLDLIRAGKAGGQMITGGTAATETLTLRGTSHASLGIVKVLDALALDATSPAQITADQDNYGGCSLRGVCRLTSDASRNITGMSGVVTGRVLYLANVGSNPIVFKHQSASSSDVNRFISVTGADVTLNSNETALGIYDGSSSRWRIQRFGFSNPVTIAAKTADETVNNSATLQNDDHLKCPAAANKRYLVEAIIAWSAASATPDFKVGWTVPASATMLWGPQATINDAASPAQYWAPSATGQSTDALLSESGTYSFGSAAITGGVTFWALESTAGTEGNIQLQWSQDTAHVSDSKFLAGSTLRCTLLN